MTGSAAVMLAVVFLSVLASGAANNYPCTTDKDCTSFICDHSTGYCKAATCFDKVQNGMVSNQRGVPCVTWATRLTHPTTCQWERQETGLDCGGNCDQGCPPGNTCYKHSDCQGLSCDFSTYTCNGFAAYCGDKMRNYYETDVDCGGPDCQPCDDSQACSVGSDCESGVCDSKTLFCKAPACNDGQQNGEETDVDCGGGGVEYAVGPE